MGDRTEGTTLERTDYNKDYSPNNCEWASAEMQANNKSDNVLLEVDGDKKTLSQWARDLDILPNTIQYRLYRGWSVEEALGLEPHIVPSKKLLKGALLEYVIEQSKAGRTQTDIGREIGIHPSAISRALKTAEERTRKHGE